MRIFHHIFNWYFTKNSLPYWTILILDSLFIYVAYMTAFYLNTNGIVFASNFWEMLMHCAATMPLMWIGMRLFHTYAGIIRYTSFDDLARSAGAIVTGQALIVLLYYPLNALGVISNDIHYKVIILTSIFALILQWIMRIVVKYIYDVTLTDNKIRQVLIYGVRKGGIALATSINSEQPRRYNVKGFITSQDKLEGRFLLGSKVYHLNNIKDIINRKEIEVYAIFVSPLFAEKFREDTELINVLTKNHIKIMMMPDAETWDGKSELRHNLLHEVEIEDLLPRDQINVDLDAIGKLLNHKRILITGAAGSIGSEMARQVAKFSPSELVLVDQAETPMHDLRRYMARKFPELHSQTIVGSISNITQMEQLFAKYRPEYVFHAAAYKHVPMMEDNPAMAVQNNLYGTRVIADLAVKYGTTKFVMISTDKAVNPTNVMGCSKRICEIYCQSLNKAIQDGSCPIKAADSTDTEPHTQFITTRFGNVLGSNGSVIPIFKEQIKKGGPVTVTHPDIIRYFMLISEACQLVLEAGTMGKGGEIFVFDMGTPVRIADLAQRMIDLSEAKNIEIKYTGLRDGEKLYEEVLNDAELTIPTHHKKIKIAKVREYPYFEVLKDEEELYQLSFTYNDMDIVRKMKEIVPEYKSQHSKYEALD